MIIVGVQKEIQYMDKLLTSTLLAGFAQIVLPYDAETMPLPAAAPAERNFMPYISAAVAALLFVAVILLLAKRRHHR